MIWLLGLFVIILLVVIIALVIRYGNKNISFPAPIPDTHNDETIRTISDKVSGLGSQVSSSASIFTQSLSGFNKPLQDMSRSLGGLGKQVESIMKAQKSFENVLNSPTKRGAWGELGLETILSEQLPPTSYTIRKKVQPLGLIPDATITLPQGLLIIDSKFPLTNYLKIMETEDKREREVYQKAFSRDLRNHLEKIRRDYVRPERGTLEFACCFIPSEAVFYWILEKEFETLREFSSSGVHLVSPLTLSQKIQMIMSGISAQKMTEETQKLKENIMSLERHITDAQKAFSLMFNTHLKNAYKAGERVDMELSKLTDTFERMK